MAGSSDDRRPDLGRTDRRTFLKLSALGGLAAGGVGLADMGALAGIRGRGNGLPGRVVIAHDPTMNGHQSTIDKDRVEQVLHGAVRLLTGMGGTAEAFESLFPGLTATSTFAVKVNCIGTTCTRWEVARAVVSGLALMRGGTYDIGQVTVYDNHNLGYYGYSAAEFTFGGHAAVISSTNNASGSGYYVTGSHQLSRYLLECDYVIDVPALKSHSDGNNQITVALKNHYGSCSPSSLCGNIPGMLTLNADPNVKDKTGLVVTDALRATWTGGPGEAPQLWSTYTEQTPNTLLVATDPVTNEYWARDMINAEREAHSMSPKPCPWVETASGAPYSLGVSDPAQMTVLPYDPSGVPGDTPLVAGSFLAPNVPNPFRSETTLRFRLGRAARARILILDARGRVVRRLGGDDYPEGYSQLVWDGRNGDGRPAPAGVYFARLESEGRAHGRRLVLTR